MKAVLYYMKNDKNIVINILDAKIFGLNPDYYSYTLSKLSMYGLTKMAALSYAPILRVNGIAPGPTIKSKRQSIKHFNKQAKSTLLKKPVGLNDICDTVEFLINNNSVTGEVVAVDSGQNLTWDIKNGKE